jgi:hypothetical protein
MGYLSAAEAAFLMKKQADLQACFLYFVRIRQALQCFSAGIEAFCPCAIMLWQ